MNPLNLRKPLLILGLLFCGLPVFGGELLSTLVDEALQANSSLEAARESVIQAESQVEQAHSSLWPSLTASGTFTHPSYVPEAVIAGVPFQFSASNQLNGKLSAQYQFFTWGRSQSSIKMAELNAETARDARLQAERAIRLAVTRTYFGISLAGEALDWARINAGLLRDQVELVKKQFANGYASDFDVLRMEVELANAESEVVARQKQVDRLNISLNRLLGRSLSDLTIIDYKLPDLPPGGVDSLEIVTTLDRHLELKMLRRSYDIFAVQESMTKIGLLRPMPSAFFNLSAGNGQFPDLDKIRTTWAAGVSISLPIFDGFQTKRKLQELTSARRELSAKERDKVDEIEATILNARLDLEESLRQIKIGQKRYEQAQASYNIAHARYENGGIGSTDLIEAQRTLRSAGLQLMSSRFEAVVKWCAMRDAEYLPYLEAFDE